MFTKRIGSFILAAAVTFCFLVIFIPNVTNIAKAAYVSSISVKSTPIKTAQLVGQDLDLTGAMITLNLSDSTTEDIEVTSDMVTGYDKTTAGTQTLTVTYNGKTATFNVTVVKKGDINGDGNVTTVDALQALQTASNRRTLEDYEKVAADVNGDGNVTAVDALKILQFVSGRLSTLEGGSREANGYGLNFTAQAQAFAASPVDNPLKGFMPFKGNYTQLPHSLEWWYIPLSALMNGVDSYTFETGLEPVLNEIAGRGHQAVFRVYLDYPNKNDNAVPQFIWDMGIAKHNYNDAAGTGVMPDWQDQRLIDVLDDFIVEFGSRYDGDSRIGFITTGLIGHWGEWHTWPEDELMPFNAQCNQIFESFDNSFNITKIVTRYPDTANAADYNIGFHDDSFTESTIGTNSWYFMPRMRSANAANKWKTEAIGGEFRPEGQTPFVNGTPSTRYQDYDACVNETHCSWLMFQKAFNNLNSEQLARVTTASKKLGYDLSVSTSTAQIPAANSIKAYVKINNTGAAPFYYKWDVKLALVNNSNSIVKQYDTDWDITTILPNTPVEYNTMLDVSSLTAGSYKLVMKIFNPLSNGPLFKFANTAQDANVSGWVTLATVTKS